MPSTAFMSTSDLSLFGLGEIITSHHGAGVIHMAKSLTNIWSKWLSSCVGGAASFLQQTINSSSLSAASRLKNTSVYSGDASAHTLPNVRSSVPASPSSHCFEHSWPLCFTYLSVSAAVELRSFVQLGYACPQLCSRNRRPAPAARP